VVPFVPTSPTGAPVNAPSGDGTTTKTMMMRVGAPGLSLVGVF